MSKQSNYKINIDGEFIKKLQEGALTDADSGQPDYFQKALKVSDETYQIYYQAANQLLEEKRFEDAADAFQFLCFLNPCFFNIWMGAGISLQSVEKYEQALRAYMMASMIESESPLPYANAYQCNLALNDQSCALEVLQAAIKCCEGKEEFTELKKQLVPLKDTLQKAA